MEKRRRRKRVRGPGPEVRLLPKFALAALVVAFLWLGWRGFVLWQATQQLPSAIVVLGGGTSREKEAAGLSAAYSDLPVYISSGSEIPCLYRTFVEEKGIPWSRVIPDLRASDTVTNFTALVPYLADRAPRKVLMMATAGQTDRAMLIGSFVWAVLGDLTVEGLYKPEIQVRYLQKRREAACENEESAVLPANVDLAPSFEQEVPR